MKIWAFVQICDGEISVSTHITEQGALLTAIADVLEYLGVEQQYFDNTEDEETYPPWRGEELKALTRKDLTRVFREWCEHTWDHYNYECDVIRTQVAP
jgi:hypothetical protein